MTAADHRAARRPSASRRLPAGRSARRTMLGALASLLASPCFAAVGETDLGTATAAAGSATLPLTTTAACPAGSLLVLFGADAGAANSINSIADSAGNTWSFGNTGTVGSGRQRFGYVRPGVMLPLANGGTITPTFAGTTGAKLAAAACFSAVSTAGGNNSVRDIDGVGTTGTSTSPSFTSSATLLSNAELVIGGSLIVAGGADAFTQDAAYANLPAALSTDALRWGWKMTTAVGAQTYAPTLGTSRTWGDDIASFVQSQGLRSMTGVGQ